MTICPRCGMNRTENLRRLRGQPQERVVAVAFIQECPDCSAWMKGTFRYGPVPEVDERGGQYRFVITLAEI